MYPDNYSLSLYYEIVNNKDKFWLEVYIMRSLIQNTEIEQKTGTLEQAGLRYGFGRNSIRKIANDAGAIIKIGKSVRINFTILDQYMDEISE